MAKINAINNESDPLDAKSITINSAYTLPNVDGAATQVIETDGGGNLSWTTPSGGSSLTWATASNSITAAANYGYIVDSVSYVTITMPAVFAVGDVVKIVGKGTGKWKVAPPAGDAIHYLSENVNSLSYFTATNYKGSCELHGITANSEWEITEVEDTEFVAGTPIKLAAGHRTSHIVNEYGDIKSWGRNNYYGLGDGTTTSTSSPISIARSFKYLNVYADGGVAFNGTLALTTDHYAVGWARSGVFGSGSRLSVSGFVVKQPTGIDFDYEYIDADTSEVHNIYLKANGEAWTSGINTYGQLGVGNTSFYLYPVSVIGGHSFIQVACGSYYVGPVAYNVCLKSDGSAWSWGDNRYGQLGDNTIIRKSSPVSVVGGHSFIQVNCGVRTCGALKADGSAWMWGDNIFGELGDNTIVKKSSPVSVVGGHSFIKIAIGNAFTTALKADGTVWSWGLNNRSQLGNNNATNYSSPISVVGGYSFIDISSGYYHTLATTYDDHIYAWGFNDLGMLGDNTTTNRSSPVSVIGL